MTLRDWVALRQLPYGTIYRARMTSSDFAWRLDGVRALHCLRTEIALSAMQRVRLQIFQSSVLNPRHIEQAPAADSVERAVKGEALDLT
jgi:hypothetical protein